MNFLRYKPKVSRKLVYGALAIIAALIFAASSVFAYDYYSAKKLEREGNSLVAAERYSDAIDKYSLAMAKWFSNKSEIEQKIEHAKELETSETNFQKCQKFFENKDYDNAISVCGLVKKEDRHYSEAQSIISDAEIFGTKEGKDKEVLGQKSSVLPKPSSATPIPIAQPSPDPQKIQKEKLLAEIENKISTIDAKIASLNESIQNQISSIDAAADNCVKEAMERAADPGYCWNAQYQRYAIVDAMRFEINRLVQEKNQLLAVKAQLLSK